MYIALGIISGLEMIKVFGRVYIRDLSTWRFWYLLGVLESVPHGYLGMTVFLVKNNEIGLLWLHSGWESACQCRGQDRKSVV